jgi:hypothetical protein
MEKIGCTDRMRNEKVLRRAKEERNFVQTIKKGLTGLFAFHFLNIHFNIIVQYKPRSSRRNPVPQISPTETLYAHALDFIVGIT